MHIRPFEVRRGMVLVGEAGLHLLVLGWTGPIPSWACFAPYRFRGRCLRTGVPAEVVVPLTGMAEVMELPELVLEFVCHQDGDLLLLDPASGEIHCLPEDQACLGPGPSEPAAVEPGTTVRVLLYDQKPVWLVEEVSSS